MRLIDGEALLAEAMADGAYGYVDAKQIADAPTIEAVPVVRCKDCDLNSAGLCRLTGIGVNHDGYCAWGERKTMAECCATCRNRFVLTRFNYSHGGCEHTKMDGFVCMAFASEGEAVWMVGLNEDGLCECYERKGDD